MTKKRSTKSALLMSALSLLLCVSMLMGTTYAWFTDSVTSANNKIVAGNLDVELKYAKIDGDKITEWDTVQGKENIFDKNALWEPGRVEVVYLEVSNLGDLALKYQLGVNIAKPEIPGVNVKGEMFKLSDYLVFSVVKLADIPTTPYTREDAMQAAGSAMGLKDYNGTTTPLEVGGFDYVALIVYMPENVGNEANYRGNAVPTIELGINLYATQQNAEEDSFGKDYDEGANHSEFKVTTANDFQNALNEAKPGEVIEVLEDLSITESIEIPAAATTFSMRSTTAPIEINLNGHTISGTGLNADGKGISVIINNGNVKLYNGTIKATGENGGATINNKGTMILDDIDIVGAPISTGEGYPAYCINNSANLTIEDGTDVTADRGCMYISGTGETIVNGGSFTNNDISDKRASFTSHVVVIGYGASNKLTINGGSFNHLHTKTSGGVVINNWSAVTVDINGGNFSGGNYFGKWDNLSDYGYGSTKTPFCVKGGTFTGMDNKFLAPGYKAEEIDGKYVVSAAIKTVEDLQNAIANAKDGDTIYVAQDITSTDGVLITDKNITIDFCGHTFSVSDGANVNNRNIKIDGSSTVTVKNGTLIANGKKTSGAYGTIRTEGTAKVTLEGLKLYSYREYGLNIKACSGTTITINNCEIYSQYGGGVEASSGNIVLNDTKIKQTGVSSSYDWCSVAIGVNGGGTVVVNSGDYYAAPIDTDANVAEGTWVAYVMSSGGTLEINGGKFESVVTTAVNASNACGIICADRAAIVNINGGEFVSSGAILDMRNNVGTQPNPVATLKGGVFSADPRISGLYSSNLITAAEGYSVVENADGTWIVVAE